VSNLARFVLPLVVLVSACGGSSKPAETSGSTDEKKTSSSSEKSATKEGGPTPKKVESKYPTPFMEPDCGSVGTDGYLPDAKKVMSEVRQAHWDKLKACADAAPAGENVSGEIRTTFRLDPDGVPRCVEAPGSSMANDEIIRCVISVYRTFRFKKTPKNGSVRITDGIHLDVNEDDD